MSKKAGGKAVGDKAKVPDLVQPVQDQDDQEEEEEEEEEEVDEVPMPSRHWYSLVCYGLPNLVVLTPSGKN